MDEISFVWFKNIILQKTGISLNDSKKELLKSRLLPRVNILNLKNVTEYQKYLQQLGDRDPEWQILVNLVTTNKTDFFREKEHFEWIINIFLVEWKKTHQRVLKIWSAACSTGEEVYTLAMILDRAFWGTSYDYQIFASDIDTNVLDVAKNGVYPLSHVSAVPMDYQKSSFTFGTEDIKGWAKIKKKLKDKVKFNRINLCELSENIHEEFDLIFCRNVFIYFKQDIIERIVNNFYFACKGSGYLIIGQSESLQTVTHHWNYVCPSIFQKKKEAIKKANKLLFNHPKFLLENDKLNKMLIAIGASTGGTAAIRTFFLGLPADIPPIVVVQHIPSVFSTALARELDRICKFRVKEAEDGDYCEARRVLIAPGGKQMKIEKASNGKYRVKITDDEPLNRHKPSVDYLFLSLAKLAVPNLIAFLLTGMGEDGAIGLLELKKQGATTIVQDEESSVVFGMPKAAIDINAAEIISNLNQMSEHVINFIRTKSHS